MGLQPVISRFSSYKCEIVYHKNEKVHRKNEKEGYKNEKEGYKNEIVSPLCTFQAYQGVFYNVGLSVYRANSFG